MQILHLDSSILGAGSASRSLTAAVVEALQAAAPGAIVRYRDLAADEIPHLNGPIAAGFRPVPAGTALDGHTVAEHARSDALVEELLASDVVVVGAPMYNFTVSSQLKAWVDRILQPGKTFRYTEKGPIGLTSGKRAIVVSTRGGAFSAGPTSHLDFQEPYLRVVFGFIGITDVRYVRAEGLSMGPDAKERSLAAARGALGEAVVAS